MKKFLALMTMAATVLMFSCDEEGDTPEPSFAAPSVTAPSTTSVQVGTNAELSFSFTAEAGFASSAVSAANGTATVSTDGTAAATSGTITVAFTAGTSVGAASVELTVTDAEGNTDEATAVINVTAEPQAPVVEVRGNVEENTTWTADNIYVLETRVTVVSGVTLTIEPGTIIKGDAGVGAAATSLIVARGATINANGTATAPIIMTSIADEITPADVAAGNFSSPNLEPTVTGLWGGLIVLGNAPISAQNDNDEDVTELQIEGIPASDPNGLYGGDNEADNSGTITYLSLRHGGTDLASGNEINGISLGGVGSATTISNVEVVANFDDGIEWFGGNVDVDGVVIWNAGDDALDTDQDWIGTCSNFLVVTPTGGSAFELDGPEGTLNRGVHNFIDGTVYAGPLGEELVDLDGSTNAGMQEIYFYGIETVIVVESFGGDGAGTFRDWQYTLGAGISAADVFVDVPAEALTEVAQNANTVGVISAADFAWTWAGNSGALAGIGL